MLIGITGGIACGKSTVTEYLKKHGCVVIDCDEITKQLYTEDSFINGLVELFGKDIMNSESTVKAEIRKLVFLDPNKLKLLDNYCYPIILERIIERIKEIKSRTIFPETIYIDAPTLFESGLNKDLLFNQIWVVYISRELQIKRLKNRNPYLTDTEIKGILERQIDIEEKKNMGTHILDNSKNIEELHKQIGEILDERNYI